LFQDQATKQGIEWQFGVNHVAHTLLVELVMLKIKKKNDFEFENNLILRFVNISCCPQFVEPVLR